MLWCVLHSEHRWYSHTLGDVVRYRGRASVGREMRMGGGVPRVLGVTGAAHLSSLWASWCPACCPAAAGPFPPPSSSAAPRQWPWTCGTLSSGSGPPAAVHSACVRRLQAVMEVWGQRCTALCEVARIWTGGKGPQAHTLCRYGACGHASPDVRVLLWRSSPAAHMGSSVGPPLHPAAESTHSC